ncbi:VOC family protein [Methylocystis sp. IM3]|uniref:VOC family protein n=1 Tax=unclassified Methylocystis TaxID=2625913 RepID=UPI0030F500C9
MTITLNHTIVPAHNKQDAAEWFADVFGLSIENKSDHFAPVRVNETLTLLFSDAPSFDAHHYAFHISDREFDAIFGRVKEKGASFGSAPWSRTDKKLNDWSGGRGVYFESPDGHLMELMTVPQ